VSILPKISKNRLRASQRMDGKMKLHCSYRSQNILKGKRIY